MGALRIAIVVAALALAGCATPEHEDSVDAPAQDSFDVMPTASKGVIKGLVVDDAIRPVAEAAVLVTPGDLTASTSQAGTFAFADLEPGQYFVRVSKAGYNETQAGVFVEAAEDPPIFKVQLARDPSRQPYVEAYKTTLLTAGACVQTTCQRVILSGTAAGQGANKLSIPLRSGATVGQTEMHWKPSTPYAGYGSNFCVSWIPGAGWVDDHKNTGPVPVTTRVNATMGTPPADLVEATLLECELQGAAGPNPPIGLMAGQQVDAFTHVFYHFTPREDWQFGRDGEYPVPDGG